MRIDYDAVEKAYDEVNGDVSRLEFDIENGSDDGQEYIDLNINIKQNGDFIESYQVIGFDGSDKLNEIENIMQELEDELSSR